MNITYTAYTDKYGVPCVSFKCADFLPSDIFGCGQAFRFEPAGEELYEGVAFDRFIRVGAKDGTITIENTSPGDFERVWIPYFDLGRDYARIRAQFPASEVLAEAAENGRGIRVLRQEPFETLVSFIISQNNNIPRIKKIISALCGLYGKPVFFRGREFRAFPEPLAIALGGADSLEAIRAGFRAKYIYAAAKSAAAGTPDLAELDSLPADRISAALTGMYGVGPKVAACVLLFAYGRYEAVPVDVWMARVLARHFPGVSSPSDYFGKYAGIAQQYLFHWERNRQRRGDAI